MSNKFYKRGLETRIINELKNQKVVLLEGLRRVGKTSLCKELYKTDGVNDYKDFLDNEQLKLYELDPIEYLRNSKYPCVIDEAQRGSNILLNIKSVVDNIEEDGKFLITGSTPLDRFSLSGSNPLAGRCVRLKLFGFTQLELSKKVDKIKSIPTSDLFNFNDFFSNFKKNQFKISKKDLFNKMIKGNFSPNIKADSPVDMVNYIDAVCDLSLETRAYSKKDLINVINYLSINTGNIVNVGNVGNIIDRKYKSTVALLNRVQELFLVNYLPNLASKNDSTIQGNKIHFFSQQYSLFANNIISSESILDPSESSIIGHIFESFVVNELIAMSYWDDLVIERCFINKKENNKNIEVDLVLINYLYEKIAIEIKFSTRIKNDDVKNIVKLNEKYGFKYGFVVYAGETIQKIPNEDLDIWAIPIGFFI